MTIRQLRAIARDAGITTWLHAARVTGPPASVSLNADEPVAIASLFKVPLAVAWADLVTQGTIDPATRLTLRPEDRAPGPTGVSTLRDEVVLSQHDAVRLMLTISDNAAADAILGVIRLDRLQAWVRSANLVRTHIKHGSAESSRVIQHETGQPDPITAELALADVDHDVVTSEYDAALASHSTAAELCAILKALWSRDQEPHRWVRETMALQAWRHRIGSGFPHDDVAVHGKTGTIGRLRHEAAVITFPDEHPVAVAVLTRAARSERHLPRVDSAIGELAREAVTALRLPRT